MYQSAGIIIWIAIGAFVGWFVGKLTHTGGSFGIGANTGVGISAAMLAGFVTSVMYEGERSNRGFLLAIAMAFLAACAAVALFRWRYPTRSPRFE